MRNSLNNEATKENNCFYFKREFVFAVKSGQLAHLVKEVRNTCEKNEKKRKQKKRLTRVGGPANLPIFFPPLRDIAPGHSYINGHYHKDRRMLDSLHFCRCGVRQTLCTSIAIFPIHRIYSQSLGRIRKHCTYSRVKPRHHMESYMYR